MIDLSAYARKIEEWTKLEAARHLVMELVPCQERADIDALLSKAMLRREDELRTMEKQAKTESEEKQG